MLSLTYLFILKFSLNTLVSGSPPLTIARRLRFGALAHPLLAYDRELNP